MMKFVSSIKRHFVIASAFFILSGCTSYQSTVSGARDLIQSQQFDEAINVLKEKALESGGDQLAYMLEYATALHEAAKYQESNKAFLAADKIADLNDYTSVSRTAGTYVVNESMAQYRAETFEYLLINVYQALNYIMLGDYENAQVMSRRIDEKLKKMEVDKESKKRQASFAAYLSAIIWEAQGDWDNAYVLYNKAYEAVPEMEQYQRDLLIAARRSGRVDSYERLKVRWPKLDKSIPWDKMKSQGEFIFFFQAGWVPRKQPRYDNQKLPTMVPVLGDTRKVVIKVDEQNNFESMPVFDLESVAVTTLEEDYKRLVAKAIARTASREAVILAAQHNNKNAGMGAAAIAALVLEITDRADLRQWSTLPAGFQVARVYLNPGEHRIIAEPILRTPGGASRHLWSGTVKIEKNKKIFMNQRAF